MSDEQEHKRAAPAEEEDVDLDDLLDGAWCGIKFSSSLQSALTFARFLQMH